MASPMRQPCARFSPASATPIVTYPCATRLRRWSLLGKAETLSEAMTIANEALDSGKAAAALDRLVAVSNEANSGQE